MSNKEVNLGCCEIVVSHVVHFFVIQIQHSGFIEHYDYFAELLSGIPVNCLITYIVESFPSPSTLVMFSMPNG